MRVLTKARLSGLVPFDKVIDDTREAEKTPSWKSIEHILNAAVNQYWSDWWRDQPCHVEVWLEKRALKRIFYPITNAFDVHLCVGGGYQSWSEVWEAKRRFAARANQELVILYFGDLDPSGKDMPRDIQQRFNLLGIPLKVREIAITKEDVEAYKLPPNPTKKRDPRNTWFTSKYGIDYSVELDALAPDVLKQKIVEAITSYADMDQLTAKEDKDQKDREIWLRAINGGQQQ